MDLEESFPWEASSQPQTNLPIPATLLVGREEELSSLADLLQDPTRHLVTLVGLAGIGKTHLALQIANSLMDQFPHGVFFVPLAQLDSPETIVTTIANAIGFQFYGADEPQEQLLRYLREKHMLLVLDNFEHLMEGTSLLSEIMKAAPRIQLLVTSRERLNLQGEWVIEVEGLSYPAVTGKGILERLESYGAVHLFTQGALHVDPSFSLNKENQEWVVRICQLTEGMPLGIELAAAWVRVLSPQTIAREIESSLDFLKASAQDIPERHRSLRAALEHSWKLLSAREKEVFQRLSVFRGGFGRQEAQEVAGASLEELTSLLDKSMLRRVDEERYELHELLRQYGAEILESNMQKLTQTHERLSDYYATLLEGWKDNLASPKHKETLAEMDNVRLAWSWMVARGQISNIRKSLRCLWCANETRGRLREGAALLKQAAVALQTADEAGAEQKAERMLVLGQVLALQGYFCAHLSRYDEAGALLQQSLALLRTNTDRAALGDMLYCLGYMKYRLGEYAEAEEHVEECLSLSRALSHHWETVHAMGLLSHIYLAQGAYERAYTLSSEGLEICRDHVGDTQAREYCLITLSTAASRLGRHAEARRWAEEGLQISKSLDDRWGMGQILRRLGLIGFELGETSRAAALIRQSVSLFRELGDRTLMAMALIDLGAVTRASEKHSKSKQYFLEALRTAMETETSVVALHALAEIAALEMEEGEIEGALELVTKCLQHSSTNLEVKQHAERLHTELVTQLTPQQIEAVQIQAQAKTLESLAQEILDTG